MTTHPSAPAGSTSSLKAADNRLYDCACQLLLTAQELRADAGRQGASAAATPTLGCLEHTLSSLAAAVSELAGDTLAEHEGISRDAAAYVLGELNYALIASARVCAAARSAIAASAREPGPMARRHRD